MARAHAAAHHNRHRCCQPQRAGTADHQHRNPPRQRVTDGGAGQQPNNKCHRRYTHHRGHKHAGDAVCQLGNRRLCRRRILHHPDDLGQGGILAHPGRLTHHIAGAVEGRRRHPVAHTLIHRQALTGERRLIHGAAALQHLAVGGDRLAGTHHKPVAGFHPLNRHRLLPLVGEQHRRLGFHRQQPPERVGGFPLGACLQHLSHGNQRQNHRRGLKIQPVHILHHRCHIAPHLRR